MNFIKNWIMFFLLNMLNVVFLLVIIFCYWFIFFVFFFFEKNIDNMFMLGICFSYYKIIGIIILNSIV